MANSFFLLAWRIFDFTQSAVHMIPDTSIPMIIGSYLVGSLIMRIYDMRSSLSSKPISCSFEFQSQQLPQETNLAILSTALEGRSETVPSVYGRSCVLHKAVIILLDTEANCRQSTIQKVLVNLHIVRWFDGSPSSLLDHKHPHSERSCCVVLSIFQLSQGMMGSATGRSPQITRSCFFPLAAGAEDLSWIACSFSIPNRNTIWNWW